MDTSPSSPVAATLKSIAVAFPQSSPQPWDSLKVSHPSTNQSWACFLGTNGPSLTAQLLITSWMHLESLSGKSVEMVWFAFFWGSYSASQSNLQVWSSWWFSILNLLKFSKSVEDSYGYTIFKRQHLCNIFSMAKNQWLIIPTCFPIYSTRSSKKLKAAFAQCVKCSFVLD